MVLLATAAGVALAVALAVAVASGSSPQTVTLGSTSGTPAANVCFSGEDCTYVPYTGASNPQLQVPFEGTVTSFSVNAGSAGGEVALRVLHPAGEGRYTAVGTSPTETLNATGVSTFDVSLPVKEGDVLGLDNESSAILFEPASGTALTPYYDPALREEVTAEPNHNAPSGYRLLLSAIVLQSPPSLSGSATSSTTTTTATPAPTSANPAPSTPVATVPVLTELAQTHRVWRESGAKATLSARRAPLGTTFSFVLDEQASVELVFSERVAGREVGHRCLAAPDANSRHKACERTVPVGSLPFAAHAGADSVVFGGHLSSSKTLKPGEYVVAVTASNSAGISAAHRLSFAIVR